MQQAAQRACHETSANGSEAAAPIAVHPIAEQHEVHRKRRAQQAPARRQPSLERPNQHSHQTSTAGDHAKPRMTENDLESGHHQSRSRHELRRISGMLKDVRTFKKCGKNVRGVGQTPQAKGVGEQQIAKLVMDHRPRNRPPGQQRDAAKRYQSSSGYGNQQGLLCGNARCPQL